MLALADAQLLAGAVAANVFVVGAGQTGKGMIRAALKRFQVARIKPIGVVLTKFDPQSVGYTYGYGYGYGYGHGYGYGYDYDYGSKGRDDHHGSLAGKKNSRKQIANDHKM